MAAGSSESRLLTLVFTDLVDSTGFKSRLGDAAALEQIGRHARALRELTAECGGREIDSAGDGFFLTFEATSAAVEFALRLQDVHRADPELPRVRVGVHAGEVTEERAPEGSSKPILVGGLAVDLAARVGALALPNQILLSGSALDSARQRLASDSVDFSPVWQAHGAYELAGVEGATEIGEVGREDFAPLEPPPDGPKGKRALPPGSELTLGWRPGLGLEIPGRLHWALRERLGEGGYGEVWLAEHEQSGARRVFKFCFDAERVRGLKREVALFRVMKDTLGDRGDITSVLDWQLDQLPFFIETAYSPGGDLRRWFESKGGARRVPMQERLELVAQVAGALGAAHSVGILHKDIKPANVLIAESEQGPRAQLTDFGIGMPLRKEVLQARDITAAGLLTETSTTGAGTQLYLAPEVLQGNAPSTVSDVYALGVLLYQVVAGDLRRALAPGWERDVPDPVLCADIAACVDGSPERRLPSAFELGERLRTLEARRPRRASSRRGRVLVGVSGVIVLAAAIGAGLFLGRSGRDERAALRPTARFEIALPENEALHLAAQRVVAVSRDGRQLAYVTLADQRIYVRRIDRLEATPIAGTEGGTSPFFSPDGNWLGFWSDRQLRKVSLAGGAPIELCPARTLYGASWSPDDRIVFGQAHHGIFEVPAAGGVPQLLVAPDPKKGEIAVEGPQLLPDGKSLLFTLLHAGENWDRASVVLQRLDTGERTTLVEGGTDPRYVPTGHLLFVRGSQLHALPFDLEARAVRGAPVPVLDNLRRAFMYETGSGHFSVSQNGTLVSVLAPPTVPNTLVWVDRSGAEEPLPMPERLYNHPRLSPDGRRVVVDTLITQDIWIYELARGTMTRLTTQQTNLHPIWSADGRSVIFDANLGLALKQKAVDGSQPAALVAADETRHLTPVSASPDGRTLAAELSDDFFTYDIAVVSLEGEGDVRPIIASPEFRETSPLFSPDGRWLAYVSDETGVDEVYVQPYPGLDRRWLVSKGGGVEPMWSRTGTELFYRTGLAASVMMAVPVSTESGFEAGEPEQLFAAAPGIYLSEGPGAHPIYDVSPDGQRFLMIKWSHLDYSLDKIDVTLNWFEELEQLAP